MSLKYRDKNGALTVLAGLTPGGNLEAGAVAERSGSFSITDIAVGGDKAFDVVFSEPMPDTDYTIVFEQLTSTCLCSVTNNTKTVNGFQIKCRNLLDTVKSCTGSYRAFKTYTVQHAEQNASDIADIKAKIPSIASSSNKLATSNELSSLGTAIDGRLDALEDTIPSSASLQNQLITETGLTTALQGKQDTLTFDDTPTEDSSNPVTSDGIKDAIDDTAADIYEVMGKNGAKNLLPFDLNELKRLNTSGTWNGASYTNNGVTFVINSDNTISTSGTSSARFGFTIYLDYDARNMIMSGCPQGGARSTYSLQYSNYSDQSFADIGNGYTIPSVINTGTWRVVIWIESGAVLNNLTFKPMIRLASDTDPTYQPYAMTNQQITPYVQSVSNPNLLDNPFFTINQRGLSTYSVTGSTGVFTLDRWKMGSWTSSGTSKTSTINVGSDGIVFVAGVNYFIQTIESDLKAHLAGRTVTLSIDYESSTTGGQFGFVVGDAWESSTVISFKSGKYVDNKTFTFPTTDSTVRAWIYLPESNTNFKVHSVKLELGTVSTLVMDTAPNYAEELLKCQRYFYKTLQFDDNGMNISPNECLAVSATRLQGIKFPVQMRANPSVTVNKVNEFGSSVTISGVAAQWNSKEGISFFSITGATVGSLYIVDFEASADL